MAPCDYVTFMWKLCALILLKIELWNSSSFVHIKIVQWIKMTKSLFTNEFVDGDDKRIEMKYIWCMRFDKLISIMAKEIAYYHNWVIQSMKFNC